MCVCINCVFEYTQHIGISVCFCNAMNKLININHYMPTLPCIKWHKIDCDYEFCLVTVYDCLK